MTAAGQVFGHLRIRTFMPPASVANGVSAFVREFIRLLGELPQDGLVVDIRGNLGGAILGVRAVLAGTYRASGRTRARAVRGNGAEPADLPGQ